MYGTGHPGVFFRQKSTRTDNLGGVFPMQALRFEKFKVKNEDMKTQRK